MSEISLGLGNREVPWLEITQKTAAEVCKESNKILSTVLTTCAIIQNSNTRKRRNSL